MKKSLKFFIQITLAFSIALGLGIAFGIDEESRLRPTGLIDHINKIVSSSCKVYVGYGRPSSNDRCYGDEVMTGYRNGYVYCSKLSVDCFSQQRLSGAGEAKK